jgi:GntR family transcriptional repressor for pyruvate dehydrogenase complex
VANRRSNPEPAANGDEGRDTVRRLLEMVREQGLREGDRLPNIRQLSATLRVKPTTVRDALLQAQVMGLVRVVPRSGAYIRSLSYAPLVDALSGTIEPALMQVDHNLFHLLDARRVLEIELAGRAAERRRLEDLLPLRQVLEAMACIPETHRRREYVEADIRFHTEIARLAGNAVLLTFQQALLGLLKPHLAQLPWTSQRRSRTDRSHAAIYTALVDGDADVARSAMREHLTMAYESLLQEVQSLPPDVGSRRGEDDDQSVRRPGARGSRRLGAAKHR